MEYGDLLYSIGTILLILFTHAIAFTIGRRLGNKEGIDYCFDHMEDDISKALRRGNKTNNE